MLFYTMDIILAMDNVAYMCRKQTTTVFKLFAKISSLSIVQNLNSSYAVYLAVILTWRYDNFLYVRQF